MPFPRKPDEMHILEGTRRNYHGDPSTEIVATGEAVCPDNLRGAARRIWDDLVPGLIERGLAKACDTYRLTSLCRWLARLETLSASLDRMKPTDKRYHLRLVQVAIVEDKLHRLTAAFGLDPVARSKLREPAKPATQRVMSRKRG